jgi:hypothetical protein
MPARRLALLATMATALLLPASASAAFHQVQVTTTEDPGASGCSLRDAVSAVNSGAPTGGCTPTTGGTEDKIFFDDALSGLTITLDGGGGQINLDDPDGLSLIGDGRSATIVAAGSGNRVFVHNNVGSVEIEDMTIRDGSQSGTAVRGGCILNQGSLTLINVRLTNCTTTATNAASDAYADGGAIGQTGGGASLALRDSLLDNNEATATNTAADPSEAQARGGAIYDESPNGVSLTNTTISGNDATATDTGLTGGDAHAMGGIAMIAGGELEISGSTISGNTATATAATTDNEALAAGGLYVHDDSSLELSTVAGNRGDATTAGGPTYQGGGIMVDNITGTFEIRSSTVALNGPAVLTGIDGGNLFVKSGEATLANTILADPRGGGENCLNLGTLTSNGFNDDYSPAGDSCFAITGSDLDSNPLLATAGLAPNGGMTDTIALQSTSPVIDQGSQADQEEEDEDQRGSTRPVDFPGLTDAGGGDGSDIGAFEVQQACAGQSTPATVCPGPPGPPAPTPVTPAKTGKRAKALKKCKKIKDKKKRSKCRKKAKKKPV